MSHRLRTETVKSESCWTLVAGMYGHGASWPQEQPVGFPSLLYCSADSEAEGKLEAAGSRNMVLGKAFKRLCIFIHRAAIRAG